MFLWRIKDLWRFVANESTIYASFQMLNERFSLCKKREHYFPLRLCSLGGFCVLELKGKCFVVYFQ